MYLLIPVLREQAVISASFRHFAALLEGRDWLSIVFVPSAKERDIPNKPSTATLLRQLQKEDPRVRIVECTLQCGVMAHQLNFAVEQIRAENVNEFFLGIYNVDSRVDGAGIDYAYDLLTVTPSTVVQQYAWYPPAVATSCWAPVLGHLALWQSRWSLHFELGRVLLDARRAPAPRSDAHWRTYVRRFHYVIGHGLFCAYSQWRKCAGFPEDEFNEDAFLGLILHSSDVAIRAVPFLEEAEPPPTIRVYLRQQATWFNGPLFAARYARKLLDGSQGSHRSRPIASSLGARINVVLGAVKLGLHAVYWLGGPPFLLLVLPTWALIEGSPWALAIWAFLVSCFVYGLNYQTWVALRSLGLSQPRPGGICSAFVAYALHCVGPAWRVAMLITGRDGADEKYKTVRHDDVLVDGPGSHDSK